MQQFIKRSFPSQKKTTSQKTKKWAEECVEAAILLATYNHTGKIRDIKANIKANYNLYDGIMNPDDIEKTVNPWGLDASSFPARMECYPIASNKINVLLGEEAKRRFDWRLRVTNDDAVSEKEKYIKDTILKALTEASAKEGMDEAQAQQIAADTQRWAVYEAQDMREKIGTQILNHLWQEQKLKLTFNGGFKDALIAGEEIYCADIIGGKPILRRVDPLSIYTVGMANTPYIDDADIIVEDTYQSIGWVIDNYYDYLTPTQIDQLEGGGTRETRPTMLINYPDETNAFLTQASGVDDSIEVGTGSSYDIDGNIRVSRAVWKSMRKIGILTYFDEETGEEVSTLVPDMYKANPEFGETVEWLWINEWWEGTKIGKDIYLKIQPRPVQFRRMDNLSLSGSGYVGTVYNTNNNRGNSLMNKMKPYVYMYNKLFYRLSKEMSKFKGPMVELDLSKKPGSWDIDKWLYYAEEMGYLVIDSFNEGVKGMAQGKLAGNFNTTGKVMNPELGNFIAQTVELLRFIDEALGLAVGITRQREGSIDNRETVGGVERSVTQSSHATEELFLTHDFTKLRALEVLLETAKYAYLNDNKVAQYIMDADLAQYIYTIDGEMFNEADYGLVMTDSTTHTALRDTLVQLAHAGIQNQMLNFSTFMDIYMTTSIADTRRKIQRAEQEMEENKSRQQEAQQEHEAKMLQLEIENREDVQAAQLEIEQLKSDTQIEVKLLDIEGRAAIANNSKEEPVQEDNSFDKEKFLKEYQLKERDLAEKKRQALVKEKQKDEEIVIKRIAANKPKSTSK